MKISNSTNWLKTGNTLSFIGVVAVNALANILPINGQNTGAISDSFPNLFVPAGITFAIWGVIYLLLAVFVLYQWGLIAKNSNQEEVVKATGIFFMLSSVFNILWILSWHYNQVLLSVAVMLLLLGSLIVLSVKLEKLSYDRKSAFCAKAPVNVYLGWISVATVANFVALFVHIGWNGFNIPQNFWTMIMVLIASLLALIGLRKYRNISYSLVTIWALAGIIIKHMTIYESQYLEIIICTGISILLITICMLKQLFSAKKNTGFTE
ncbi:MAG: tryptophan-rich sensory protein [Clostridia bacterium]|nr:tryptophan-rich sensory protein [Clostridia bacterium]